MTECWGLLLPPAIHRKTTTNETEDYNNNVPLIYNKLKSYSQLRNLSNYLKRVDDLLFVFRPDTFFINFPYRCFGNCCH